MDTKYAAFIGMGAELITMLLIGIFLGRFADQRWELEGMGMAAGTVGGLVVWFVHLLVMIRGLEKNSNQDGT